MNNDEIKIASVPIHSLGLEKLDDGFKIKPGKGLGTLFVTSEGISYAPHNAKKEPDSVVGWEQLEALINLAATFGK